MGFIAKRFSFDHIPCEEFGLRIYDIDGDINDAAPFASAGELETDVNPSTGRVFLYGRSYKDSLEFNLVFGVDPYMIKMDQHLDRYEMDAIANWLIGNDTFKWLEIEQPDLETIRYHCIISELKPIQLSWLPWAFSAKIQCDSPYGYMHSMSFQYASNGTVKAKLISRSTIHKMYYPKVEIDLNGSNTISIINRSCNNAEIKFSNLPRSSGLKISVDNALGKIVSSDVSYSNLYKHFNFQWFPLKKGVNNIEIVGKCNVKFICEFPVNFGG